MEPVPVPPVPLPPSFRVCPYADLAAVRRLRAFRRGSDVVDWS